METRSLSSPGAEIKRLKGQCGEAEARKGPITCPKPQSVSVVELGPYGLSGSW